MESDLNEYLDGEMACTLSQNGQKSHMPIPLLFTGREHGGLGHSLLDFRNTFGSKFTFYPNF